MRQFIFVLLLLASLPAAAKAVPYAEYDPRTGDIAIRGLNGIANPGGRFRMMRFGSISGKLNPLILSSPVEIAPANSLLPQFTMKSTEWLAMVSTTNWFEFTSIKIPGAFLPGTPLEDIYYVDTYRATSSRQGAVVEIPEPGGFALLIMAAAGVIASRRRR
jgi:hypothetical protein